MQYVNVSFQVTGNECDDALVAAAPSPGQPQFTCTQVLGAYLLPLLEVVCTTSQPFIIPCHEGIGAPTQEG